MRRANREVTDPEEIRRFLASCRICRLGLCEEGKSYIVPLNFGFTEENGSCEIVQGKNACGYTAYYQSVIGNGRITFLDDPEEKRYALAQIMEHNTGKKDWDFPDSSLTATCVYQLTVTELHCKRNGPGLSERQ